MKHGIKTRTKTKPNWPNCCCCCCNRELEWILLCVGSTCLLCFFCLFSIGRPKKKYSQSQSVLCHILCSLFFSVFPRRCLCPRPTAHVVSQQKMTRRTFIIGVTLGLAFQELAPHFWYAEGRLGLTSSLLIVHLTNDVFMKYVIEAFLKLWKCKNK